MSTTTNGHDLGLGRFQVGHLTRTNLGQVAPQVPTAAPAKTPMLARTWIAISEQRQATKDRNHARRVQELNARATATKTSRPVWQRTKASLLWLREQGLMLLGYLTIMVVVYSGWSASFIGLHAYAMAHMALTSRDAWYVPLAFDGAAVGLTIVVAVEAMHGRGAATWRLLIAAFTGLSSWINWEHIADPGGRNIAALLPVSAVVLFEGLMSRARRAYEDRVNPGRQKPRFHPLRWVFDFKGTKAIVRAYVLGIELPETFAAAVETVEQERRPRGKRTPKRRSVKAAQPVTATAEAADSGDVTQPMPRLVAPAQDTVTASRDGLDRLAKDDLVRLAKRHGVPVRGSKQTITGRLRDAGVASQDAVTDGVAQDETRRLRTV